MNIERVTPQALPVRHCAPEAGPGNGEMPHGNYCECVLLAAAVGAGPQAISFHYCLNVLQKRWLLTCRHGEMVDTGSAEKTSEKWRNFGEMDAVKAILVKNG